MTLQLNLANLFFRYSRESLDKNDLGKVDPAICAIYSTTDWYITIITFGYLHNGP